MAPPISLVGLKHCNNTSVAVVGSSRQADQSLLLFFKENITGLEQKI